MPQPLLTGPVLQPHHLKGFPWTPSGLLVSVQYCMVRCGLISTEWRSIMTALDLWLCSCSCSPGGCWSLLLPGLTAGPCPPHCLPALSGPFPQSCSSGGWSQPVLLHRALKSMGQDLALALAEFQEVSVSPLRKTDYLPLNYTPSPTIESVGPPTSCHLPVWEKSTP